MIIKTEYTMFIFYLLRIGHANNKAWGMLKKISLLIILKRFRVLFIIVSLRCFLADLMSLLCSNWQAW